MKYKFMRDNRHKFSIKRMSSIFDVSCSSYYKFVTRKSSYRTQEEDRLLVKIKDSYDKSRQTYGSPRISQN